MNDRLPRIKVNLHIDPDEFLARMENIAIASGLFDVRRDDYGEGYRLLNMRFNGETPHQGLLSQIIIDPNDSTTAKLNTIARRWESDPLTYEAYVEAATNIFGPLIETYNHSFSARMRLSIQSKEDTEPQLPTGAKRVFENFLFMANRDALRAYDWNNFYHFIWYCASFYKRLDDEDVFRLLVINGFTEESARKISDVYYHGTSLLKATR